MSWRPHVRSPNGRILVSRLLLDFYLPQEQLEEDDAAALNLIPFDIAELAATSVANAVSGTVTADWSVP